MTLKNKENDVNLDLAHNQTFFLIIFYLFSSLPFHPETISDVVWWGTVNFFFIYGPGKSWTSIFLINMYKSGKNGNYIVGLLSLIYLVKYKIMSV